MSPASIARLVCLAAIWGGAFMIIRIAAPVVGPIPLIVARVGLAAIFLTVVARTSGRCLNVAAHWRHYLMATAIAVPLIALAPPSGPPAVHVVLALLVLGIVCTGFAFLVFFRLIQDIGAGAALTVTFLVPVFGIAWGSIFLGERIGWNTVTGSALVVMGTALVATGPLRRCAPRCNDPIAGPEGRRALRRAG